jgi:hypothetical protein
VGRGNRPPPPLARRPVEILNVRPNRIRRITTKNPKEAKLDWAHGNRKTRERETPRKYEGSNHLRHASCRTYNPSGDQFRVCRTPATAPRNRVFLRRFLQGTPDSSYSERSISHPRPLGFICGYSPQRGSAATEAPLRTISLGFAKRFQTASQRGNHGGTRISGFGVAEAVRRGSDGAHDGRRLF